MLLVDCYGVVIDSSFNYMEIYFQRVNTEDEILSLFFIYKISFLNDPDYELVFFFWLKLYIARLNYTTLVAQNKEARSVHFI